MMERSDTGIWNRVRAGDAQAFAMLFERHAEAIYNYCFRRIGKWESAEDLMSIVFLEAWRRRSIELPENKILPWLYGVAGNVVRNEARSQRRFAAALRRLPEPLSEPDFTELSDQRADDEDVMRNILGLVSQLPRGDLEVFALCAWSDLTYEDAAFALGIPVGTVRSRLSRARAHLRSLSLPEPERKDTSLQEG